MYRLSLLATLVLCLASGARGQITLAPGDVALTYVQATNPDRFAFVALNDIVEGTVIYFADCGVQSDGRFRSNEGAVQYVVPAGGLAAGDEVMFEAGSPVSSGFTVGEDGGAGCTGGNFLLADTGDQVVVYQTDGAETTADIEYLFVVTTNSTGFSQEAETPQETTLPPGLAEGVTAVWVDPEKDNVIFDGSLQTGTKVQLLKAIGDALNWSGSNTPITYDETTFDFAVEPSVSQPLVFTTPNEPNTAAAWRLLSPPVDGFLIDDLAGLNLVQGVAAGGTTEAQYATAGANVLVALNGTTRDDFVTPATTDEEIEPGQGFFWYLYDRTIDPTGNGEGTSKSFELTGFFLSAAGTAPTTTQTFSPLNYTVTEGSRWFLIGNPFDQDLDVGGITSVPARQTVLQTWDPEGTNTTGDVVGGFQAFEDGTSNEVLAVWQGAYAEISDMSAAPTFTYDASARTGTRSGPFYGRSAPTSNAIALWLSGQTDAGAPIGDNLAIVRFAGDAEVGWDLRDASKLMPPTQDYALLAPMTTRDGAPWRTAVNTLPEGTVTVPVQFTTTGSGSFTIGADVTLSGGTQRRPSGPSHGSAGRPRLWRPHVQVRLDRLGRSLRAHGLLCEHFQ